MKVKNIMFSGVMAAILSATGASAAINVASQGYVDSKVGALETSVSNTYLTQEDAADTYATTQYVTENITNVLGNETDGLVADVKANTDAIAANATEIAKKANAADVYTKDEANAKFEEQAAATQKLTESKAYTDSQIKELTESLGGVGEDGESTGLTGTVAAQGVRIGALEDKVGATSVADQIAGALTTAQGYADTAEADAIAAAKTYTDEKTADMATKTELKDYAKQADLTAEITARETAVKAVDDKLGDYTKTSDLDAGFVSEIEMTAFKSENTDAIADAKKAGTDAQATADANATAISDLESDLATKITMPEVCATTNCVLSTLGGTIQWVPLTEPLDSTASN